VRRAAAALRLGRELLGSPVLLSVHSHNASTALDFHGQKAIIEIDRRLPWVAIWGSDDSRRKGRSGGPFAFWGVRLCSSRRRDGGTRRNGRYQIRSSICANDGGNCSGTGTIQRELQGFLIIRNKLVHRARIDHPLLPVVSQRAKARLYDLLRDISSQLTVQRLDNSVGEVLQDYRDTFDELLVDLGGDRVDAKALAQRITLS